MRSWPEWKWHQGRTVLNQLFIELIELPTWARAIREVLTAPGAPRIPEIVFAQEANGRGPAAGSGEDAASRRLPG